MNYRHAYHAGNFADVFKHTVLIHIIRYLQRKDGGIRIVDTHAGTGMYALDSAEAQKTGEWREGIGRLLGLSLDEPEGSLPTAGAKLVSDETVAAYLELVRRYNSGAQLNHYPGSPVIARDLLRGQDVLVANELHPADFEALQNEFIRDRQTKTLNLDGWLVPKSVLPPKERRGVVLIDPPFEQPDEFGRMTGALTEGVRRFATGTYVFWYPIKDPAPVSAFKHRVRNLGLGRIIAAELFIRSPLQTSVLNGCGLLIHNPPFGLIEWLEGLLPLLAEVLAQDAAATWRLETHLA
ncbi:MAG TPA: 23S rRNA (adenine(2030)-N(6))-methyltransferase RlmJ [Hyphomicrobiaceae bacterium]|nr:23S rRNA (adenine(2030)-N(6))-methyltransferase RlmJ [Hyphomicrobiaceae bacterium]